MNDGFIKYTLEGRVTKTKMVCGECYQELQDKYKSLGSKCSHFKEISKDWKVCWKKNSLNLLFERQACSNTILLTTRKHAVHPQNENS